MQQFPSLLRAAFACAVAALIVMTRLPSASNAAGPDDEWFKTVFLQPERGIRYVKFEVAANFNQTAASQIQITHAAAAKVGSTSAAESAGSALCTTFVNRSTRTATRVQFRFAYIGRDGTELGHDMMELKGKFAPGVEIGNWDGTALGELRYCGGFEGVDYGIEPNEPNVYRKFWYTIAKQPASLTATVVAVGYQDGTSGRAPGFAGEYYPNPIVGAIRQEPGSPVEISEFFATVLHRGSASECVFFVNRSPHIVTAARFSISYVTANGEEAGRDVLEEHGRFAPGALAETWPDRGSDLSAQCRDFTGTIGSPRPLFRPKPPRRIRYEPANQDVTITASVLGVDYDDGTSWGR